MASLWIEIQGHLARKPKSPLFLVDNTFIKVHQAGQGTIVGSKHQAIELTKAGTTQSSLRPLINAHVVALLPFPEQCAETTAGQQLLPLLGKTMVFVWDKELDFD
jgi:hypothetical protein